MFEVSNQVIIPESQEVEVQQVDRQKKNPGFFARFVRKLIKVLVISLISLIILGTLAIIVVFHSPYTYLKELYVTTAMATMDHQYLARIFVSEAEINQILKAYKMNPPTEYTNTGDITVRYKGSKDIQLIKVKGLTYKGYLLVVKDPSRVSIATTGKLGKKGMLVEDIVKDHKAVAGINAGGFLDEKGHGSGGIPLGVLIENKKMLNPGSGEKQPLIGINKNNKLVLGNFTLKQIKRLNIRDAASFQPLLVINGKPQIKKGDGGQGIQPRTAIGQKKDGTMLFLVIDGRQVGSIGATLKDVQTIMLRYGAHNAANLDGGSSTTMIYKNDIVNNPCSSAGPRYVPSAFIVKK